MLVVDKVYKIFTTKTNKVTALEDICFEVKEKEFICLVGPSGCGKSTLLNLIAGLEYPDSGAIYLDGKPIVGPGSDRVVLFQESALFPWLNVFDNILFGLKLKPQLSNSERKEIALFYLQLVGFEKFKYSNVH